jgi:hypothetical protein
VCKDGCLKDKGIGIDFSKLGALSGFLLCLSLFVWFASAWPRKGSGPRLGFWIRVSAFFSLLLLGIVWTLDAPPFSFWIGVFS